jgi:signal transduction histidine kinase
MAWQFHPLLVLFALGGLVSLVVTGYCWRYMQRFGRSHLVASIGLLGFNNAVWVFAAFLKTASTDLTLSLLFYKLEFLGVLPNTVVALVVALVYVGKDRWLAGRTVTLLSLVPTAFVLLVLVNPGDVMIVNPKLIPAQGIMAFEHEFPPLFVVYLAWVYGAVLVAILILAWGMIADRVPATPALVAIAALLVSWVTTVLKTAGIYPPGGTGINVTPAASTIGISILAFAVIRYQVFELIPVGRDQAVEVMPDGYLFVGPDETILDANPAAAELLVGRASAELKNRSVAEVVSVYDDLTETSPTDLETEGRTVELRHWEVTRQNQDAGEVLLLHDVTENRQREQKLERTNERLDQFAGVVTHDLRNPLNVVKGRLAIARGDHDTEHLAKASNALERMERLIDDVLTLARHGPPISEPERITVSSVANRCWKVVDSHDATLAVESDIAFLADSERLQQLLENLFRNAIEHGGSDVTIRVGALDDASGFYVSDDGMGIPEDKRGEVFESGYSTARDGTGFGLAIVKEIADAHEWRVRVTESAEGGARVEVAGVEPTH